MSLNILIVEGNNSNDSNIFIKAVGSTAADNLKNLVLKLEEKSNIKIINPSKDEETKYALQNIDKFNGDSKLYTWMYRIATNESITFLNSKARRNKVSNETLNENALQNLVSDVYFDGDEIQLKLQKAIAQLPRIQQLVFNMRYFDNIKYKDMSAILETSEGALKASYHIAVKKIKTYLLAD